MMSERSSHSAHELGFDTLIIHAPTPTIMEAAGALGVKVAAIVTPNADDAFARQHPDALQQMLPAEEAMADAARSLAWEPYTIRAHRWFPIVQMSPLLCFEHPAARAELQARVQRALAVADGVAFDGFGFANHYGCFCERCQATRQEMQAQSPTRHEAEILAHMSEASLIEISQVLYAHAKALKPKALVTNHLWPPFRPNPYYGSRLKLDFCSQTISWFYKPNWSLPRVEFEAQEMKRLEEPAHNRFAPFIAMFHEPYLARSGLRIAQELAIAQRYGDGHLIFCSLKAIHDYPDVYDAVKTALRG
ncbi:MAG: hypothetical protein R2911_42310 [Caldilineaceae bacterium]